ncbi:MAG: hypothetical protein NC218_08240 [Acetobacter sp.]|nr:hypothetical protein [Acetobacter sp.]
MAKVAKKIQTDYTTGGRDISNTAIPLYQENLGRVDQYLADPTSTIDKYLDKYYTNTSNESDFLRQYNRAMAGQTGRNYNATQGGYSSLNQMNYDDLQRYQNDLASRLRDYGVTSSAQLAQNYYNSLLAGNQTYNTAYGLGKDYSDIEQYNNAVKQHNKFLNQLGGMAGTLGTVAGAAVGGPVGAAMGNALGSALGSTIQTDTSNVLGEVGRATGGANTDLQKAGLGMTGDELSKIKQALASYFGGNNTSGATPYYNPAQAWGSGSNLNGVGYYGLNQAGQQQASNIGDWGLSVNMPGNTKFSWDLSNLFGGN